MLQLQSILGIVALIGFAFAISENRAAVPWRKVGAGLALTAVLAVALLKVPPVRAVFAAVNASLTVYAVVAFIGLRNSLVDLVLGAVAWVRVPREPRRRPAVAPDQPSWEAVLYLGPDAQGDAPVAALQSRPLVRRGDTRDRQR